MSFRKRLPNKKCLRILILILPVWFIICCSDNDLAWNTTISPKLVDYELDSKKVTIGYDDILPILSNIYANGAYTTTNLSLIKSSDLDLSFKQYANKKLLIESFKKREIPIISLPLNYHETYKLIQDGRFKIFYLNSWIKNNIACVTNQTYLKFSDLKNNKIACVKGSPAHYLTKLFLNINNISIGSIKWQFVKSNEEALKFLKKMKVDAVVVNHFKLKDKLNENYKILFSNNDCAKFIPNVLLADKEYLLTHKNLIKYMLASFIKAEYKFARLRRKAVKKIFNSLKLNQNRLSFKELKKSFIAASYIDNRYFFRLTQNQAADVYKIIDLCFGDSKNKKTMQLSKEFTHTIELAELYKKFRRQRYSDYGRFYVRNRRKQVADNFYLVLPFVKGQQTYTTDADSRLEQISFLADIFSQKKIILSPVISPGYKTSSTLTYERYAALQKILTREYRVSSRRILLRSKPHTDDILHVNTESNDYLVAIFKN